jgi:uncharacterized protein DUF998
MKFDRRILKWAGIAGKAGPLLFGAVTVLLSYVQYDFMRSLGWDPLRAPTFDWPSGLALGPLGWLMTAAFIVSGAALSLVGFGLRLELNGPSGRIGSALLMTAGLALAGLAFATDPTIRSTPATWHGRLHDVSFALLGLALIPAMIFLGASFRHSPPWEKLSVCTWGTAALAIPAFAIKGLALYVFLAAVLGWSETIALQLEKAFVSR